MGLRLGKPEAVVSRTLSPDRRDTLLPSCWFKCAARPLPSHLPGGAVHSASLVLRAAFARYYPSPRRDWQSGTSYARVRYWFYQPSISSPAAPGIHEHRLTLPLPRRRSLDVIIASLGKAQVPKATSYITHTSHCVPKHGVLGSTPSPHGDKDSGREESIWKSIAKAHQRRIPVNTTLKRKVCSGATVPIFNARLSEPRSLGHRLPVYFVQYSLYLHNSNGGPSSRWTMSVLRCPARGT